MLFRIIVFLSFFSFFSVSAQNAIKGYVDGKIYVKFKKNTLTGLQRENPKDIPLQLLTPFRQLVTKYNVTRVNKPFYHATDDERLMQIYKFHFADIAKVNLLIEDLNNIP